MKALVATHREGKFYRDFELKTRHLYFLQSRAIITIYGGWQARETYGTYVNYSPKPF